MVDAAVAAVVALLAADQLPAVGLGAAAAVVGIGLGPLAIMPWKPRPRPVWPTLALAGHGISMGLLLAAALLLYSAARPEAPAFLAAVAIPFPVAMIAQASLVLGPALQADGTNDGVGRPAQDQP